MRAKLKKQPELRGITNRKREGWQRRRAVITGKLRTIDNEDTSI